MVRNVKRVAVAAVAVAAAALLAPAHSAYAADGCSEGWSPGGLDRFADEVVPLLQERGSFRADYASVTVRDHFGGL